MKNVTKKLLIVTVLFASTFIMQVANSLTYSEACISKYLCFYDYTTKNYGRVEFTNTEWKYLNNTKGTNWDNITDWFWNRGTSYNACIYKNEWFGGSSYHLSRGESFQADSSWKNVVSSNRWTSRGYCS